jgi:hypothetical protein
VTTSQFHSTTFLIQGNNYYEKDFLTSINEFYKGCELDQIDYSYSKYVQGFQSATKENESE